MSNTAHTTIEMTPVVNPGRASPDSRHPALQHQPHALSGGNLLSPEVPHHRAHVGHTATPNSNTAIPNNNTATANSNMTIPNIHTRTTNGSTSRTSPAGSHNNLGPEEGMPLLSRNRRDLTPERIPPHPTIEPTYNNVLDNTARPRPELRLNVNLPGNRGQPLIETDANMPRPPLAGPEIDDLDFENNIPNTAEAHPGVDDGFFNPNAGHDNRHPDDRSHTDDGHSNPDGWPHHGEDGDQKKTIPEGDQIDGYVPDMPALSPRFGETPFPYAPEFGPGAQTPRIIPDVNVYQQKKNLAQGMMDLALLSANANQLRYVLEAGEFHPYYYPSLIFICSSLILQIGVGVGLIVNSTYNIKDQSDICKADRINDFTVIGIFLITIVNVFVASFGVSQLPPSAPMNNNN